MEKEPSLGILKSERSNVINEPNYINENFESENQNKYLPKLTWDKLDHSISDYEKRFLNSLKKLNSPKWLLNENSKYLILDNNRKESDLKFKNSSISQNNISKSSTFDTSNRLSKNSYNKIKFKNQQFHNCDAQDLQNRKVYETNVNEKLTNIKNSKSLVLLASDNTAIARETNNQIVYSTNSLNNKLDYGESLNQSKSNESFNQESRQRSFHLDLKIKKSHSNYSGLNKTDFKCKMQSISKSNYSLYYLNSKGCPNSLYKPIKSSWYKPKNLKLPSNLNICDSIIYDSKTDKKTILDFGKYKFLLNFFV
jgi:hypothetical protein